MRTHRVAFALTAAAGGLLAALSFSTASASADVDALQWIIEPSYDDTIVSTGGMAPFDQSIVESGGFAFGIINPGGSSYEYEETGQLINYTDIFGFHNEDFVISEGNELFPVLTTGSVIDEMSFGSGFENVYIDDVGTGVDGQNVITDTLYTPFGDFNLPITVDEAIPAEPGAAEVIDPSGFLAALDADWTTLVTDFSALF